MDAHKKHWMELYRKASPEARQESKKHWLDVWKNAIFPESLADAERHLAWAAIIDAE